MSVDSKRLGNTYTSTCGVLPEVRVLETNVEDDLDLGRLETQLSLVSDKELEDIRLNNYHVMQNLTSFKDEEPLYPSVGSWYGREKSLLAYQHLACVEWHVNRGLDDQHIFRKTADLFWDCFDLDFDSHEVLWEILYR